MQSIIFRLGLSIFIIIATTLGDRISLPFLDRTHQALTSDGDSSTLISIFLLSIYPFIYSTLLIHLLSFWGDELVKKRQGGPKGQAELDRIADVLGFVFALILGYASAYGLASLDSGGLILGSRDRFLVIGTLTLATASTLTWWLVRYLLSRYGFYNGVLLYFGSFYLLRLYQGLEEWSLKFHEGLIPKSEVFIPIASYVFLVVLLFRLALSRSQWSARACVGSVSVILPSFLLAVIASANDWADYTTAIAQYLDLFKPSPWPTTAGFNPYLYLAVLAIFSWIFTWFFSVQSRYQNNIVGLQIEENLDYGELLKKLAPLLGIVALIAIGSHSIKEPTVHGLNWLAAPASLLSVVLLALTVTDLYYYLEFCRQHRDLVCLVESNNHFQAAVDQQVLEHHKIPVYCEGLSVRNISGIFAPHIRVRVWIPRAQLDLAQQRLPHLDFAGTQKEE